MNALGILVFSKKLLNSAKLPTLLQTCKFLPRSRLATNLSIETSINLTIIREDIIFTNCKKIIVQGKAKNISSKIKLFQNRF